MARAHRTAAGGTALALLLALGGCGGAAAVAPEGEAYVRGPVRSITHHATATGLLVEAGPGSREPCGIAATADAETRYLRRAASGAVADATLAEVAVGDTVEVYVDGPVAESCPVQGRASAIVLVAPAP